ncbi:MAG TPA: SCO family protein, partial [Thermoanaerobaculia bacterium]|nr:SCO family protein [Thermoanaerobaculia bacterium]
AATSKAFAVTVQYGMPKAGPETASYYYVDHTGTFFIVDPEGRLRLRFPPGATVDQMLPDIEKLLAV